MNVTILGATGFVGRALSLRFLRDGHHVSALTRSVAKAQQSLGADVELVPWQEMEHAQRALSKADVVINLAGENILGGRWTSRRKQALYQSRVDVTRRLVGMLPTEHPTVLLSASAVGYYGDSGSTLLNESSPAGTGFLSKLCQEWESAALTAGFSNLRVAVFRIGVVLGLEGGALGQMLPVFRLGLGGRLGSGRQYWSWIHLNDLVELFVTAARDPAFAGVFNAVAPGPVQNREFTAALGKALGKPTPIPVMKPALRLAFGEAADALLQSQRVIPERSLKLGFQFGYSELRETLDSLLALDKTVVIDRAPSSVGAMGVRKRRPTFRLRQSLLVKAPLNEVFAFFSCPQNLAFLTPSWAALTPLKPPPRTTEQGLVIDYRMRIGPVPLTWRTQITVFETTRRFVDEQLKGPYSLWCHEHRFISQGSQTQLQDEVFYRLPLSSFAPLRPLSNVVHRLFVAPKLRSVFAFRAHAIAFRFGSPIYAKKTHEAEHLQTNAEPSTPRTEIAK